MTVQGSRTPQGVSDPCRVLWMHVATAFEELTVDRGKGLRPRLVKELDDADVDMAAEALAHAQHEIARLRAVLSAPAPEIQHCPDCGATGNERWVHHDACATSDLQPVRAVLSAPREQEKGGIPSEAVKATGYVSTVLSNFFVEHGEHGGPLASVTLNYEDGSQRTLGHEIQTAVRRLVDGFPAGSAPIGERGGHAAPTGLPCPKCGGVAAHWEPCPASPLGEPSERGRPLVWEEVLEARKRTDEAMERMREARRSLEAAIRSLPGAAPTPTPRAELERAGSNRVKSYTRSAPSCQEPRTPRRRSEAKEK